LSVEEQFYLVWTFVLAAALWIGGRRPAVATAIVFFCASLTLRTYLTVAGYDGEALYRATLTRADSLAAGCIAALAAPAVSFRLSKAQADATVAAFLLTYVTLVLFATKSSLLMATIGVWNLRLPLPDLPGARRAAQTTWSRKSCDGDATADRVHAGDGGSVLPAHREPDPQVETVFPLTARVRLRCAKLTVVRSGRRARATRLNDTLETI
jgi:hypothetical protein